MVNGEPNCSAPLPYGRKEKAMKYVITVWQNAKYRGVIEAENMDDAYEKAEDAMMDIGLPECPLEWVNEDVDYDICECK